MDWGDFEYMYNTILNSSFQDEDVYEIYQIVYNFNKKLFDKMVSLECYKEVLKYCRKLSPNMLDYQTILDGLKDIILIGGSQDYSIDGYMDWDGLVQEEIGEFYVEFRGEYIPYDELEELYSNIRKYCI